MSSVSEMTRAEDVYTQSLAALPAVPQGDLVSGVGQAAQAALSVSEPPADLTEIRKLMASPAQVEAKTVSRVKKRSSRVESKTAQAVHQTGLLDSVHIKRQNHYEYGKNMANAVEKGDLKKFEKLCRESPDSLDYVSDTGESLTFTILKMENLAFVDAALQAKPDLKDSFQQAFALALVTHKFKGIDTRAFCMELQNKGVVNPPILMSHILKTGQFWFFYEGYCNPHRPKSYNPDAAKIVESIVAEFKKTGIYQSTAALKI